MLRQALRVLLAWILISPAFDPRPVSWAAEPATTPVRLSLAAFGATAQVEVQGLPRASADAAARAALLEIHTLDQLVDPGASRDDGVAALNASAGQGPRPLGPRMSDLLRRGLQFCFWSAGAYGPLGGELAQLWESHQPGLSRPGHSTPAPADLRRAAESAACSRLTLQAEGEVTKATLAAGSTLDLRSLARGYAVDRAFQILREQGVTNAWVEIDNVMGGIGGGPDGTGWLASLPPAPGAEQPADQVWLRGQMMALLESSPGDAPIFDQRTGVPASGVVLVVAVTDLAVDAQGLVHVLYATGLRDGQRRLGSLSPRPSVYWLLGDGVGRPLEASYRWSELKREIQR